MFLVCGDRLSFARLVSVRACRSKSVAAQRAFVVFPRAGSGSSVLHGMSNHVGKFAEREVNFLEGS